MSYLQREKEGALIREKPDAPLHPHCSSWHRSWSAMKKKTGKHKDPAHRIWIPPPNGIAAGEGIGLVQGGEVDSQQGKGWRAFEREREGKEKWINPIPY
jgi:hypothetical protein